MVETDRSVAALSNADKVKMDVQNVSGAKDSSGTLYSVNPPISVAKPKPRLSNMESRPFLSIKTPSFASSNFYPSMSLNAPATFGGGIKYKAATSSLSGEVSLLKVVWFTS